MNEEANFQEKFLQSQYDTLRKEIEASKERLFKIGAGALILVPAVEILAIAVKETVLANQHTSANEPIGSILVIPLLVLLLLLPIIVLVLHALFFSEHVSISRCGRYIRDYIEPRVKTLEGWEGWMGWEEWLGDTWLQRRARASKKLQASKEPRAHKFLQMLGLDFPFDRPEREEREERMQERLQEFAFRFLYISLYLLAVVSIVFVSLFLIERFAQQTGAEWITLQIKVLVGLGLSLFYLLLWGLERWLVNAAMAEEASRIAEEQGKGKRAGRRS